MFCVKQNPIKIKSDRQKVWHTDFSEILTFNDVKFKKKMGTVNLYPCGE